MKQKEYQSPVIETWLLDGEVFITASPDKEDSADTDVKDFE